MFCYDFRFLKTKQSRFIDVEIGTENWMGINRSVFVCFDGAMEEKMSRKVENVDALKWLTVWLTDRSIDWFINWLDGWLVDWFIHALFDWLIEWLII